MNEGDQTYLTHLQAGEQLAPDQRKARKIIRAKRRKKALLVVLVLFLWAGFVYGGYLYASAYLQGTEQRFTSQLDELKLQNERIEEEIITAMQLFQSELESTNQEIAQIRQEMDIIQEELELTGESMTGTDETRQSLLERVGELDRQLLELQGQLEKLEEAMRAF